MTNATLEHALAYARNLPGRLLPVAERSKTPTLKDWTTDATTDPATLERWFASDAKNLGWTPAPGLVVLDVDLAGFASLEAVEREHGPLPATLTASTPSGGRHHVFRLPEGAEACNRAGKHGTPYAGLDIRAADRGFIVVAPSSTPAGQYQWLDWSPLSVEPPAIADAPEWLTRYAVEGQPKAKGEPVAAAGPIAEGGRNDALFREGARLRALGLAESAIVAQLLDLNNQHCKPPLSEREVHTIAESAGRYTPDFDPAAAQSPDVWRSRIELVGRDGAAMEQLVRNLAADAGLGDIEREQLLKTAAKAAGAPIRHIRKIAADAMREHIDDGRPVVNLAPGRLHEAVTASIKHLATVPALRIWGGRLIELTEGRLVDIERARLATLLASAVRFTRGGEATDAPRDLLDAILAAPEWPGVPSVDAVHRQPCAVGELPVTEAGHAAGIEAAFKSGDFPAFRSAVLDHDGKRYRFGADKCQAGSGLLPLADTALAQLRWLLSGFEFESPLDEVCALALLLTAVARPGLPTAPAFLISADQPGAGKSHLARIAAALACGGMPSELTWRTGRERIDVLESALLHAPACLLFDNVERGTVIYDDALAKVLTSEKIGVRQKGHSLIREVGTRSLILFTGNAISIRSDMNRRCLTIRLKPHKSRQAIEAAGGPADPLRLVRSDRGRWVQAVNRVLGDARGCWLDNPPPAPLDSFETWDASVRRVLLSAALPDPVASVQRARAEDEESAQLERFASAWMAVFGNEGVTLATAWDHVKESRLEDQAELRHAMLDLAGTVAGQCDVRRLGYTMRGHQCFGRWRLRDQTTQHKGGGRRYGFEPVPNE